jgi:murein DD-endopeptidase MepM/ murein hydrolase activator NlpD
LKKKYYTIFFISNDDSRREFTISNYLVITSLLFGIGLIIITGAGIWNLLDKSKLQDELEVLRRFEHSALKVIVDLGAEDLLMQQPDIEVVLIKYFGDDPDRIPMNSPVDGYITQNINPRGDDKHFGVDIAAKSGDTIVAPADGLVVFSGETSSLGKMIILSHALDFYTLFGHIDTNYTSVREYVKASQPIGSVGGLGDDGGPHLHFEIWKGDQVIDPVKFIENYKDKDVSNK